MKLLMFDLDGTLFHTAPGIQKSINFVLKKHNLRELSYVESMHAIGYGINQLVKNVASHFDAKKFPAEDIFIKDFRDFYNDILLSESFLYEGVLNFLSSWNGSLAVVSNKEEAFVKRLINESELKQFNWLNLIGGNTFSEKKPHPLPLNHVIKGANLPPSECVIIGDGLPDILAAKAAKIKSIAVAFGYTPINELMAAGATISVNNFSELPTAIQHLSVKKPQ